MSDLPDINGVSHRWLRARGLEFHLAEAGAGENVVLCLHGWPQHWYEWRHLLPALADRHRVIALDLRGFGWSAMTGAVGSASCSASGRRSASTATWR